MPVQRPVHLAVSDFPLGSNGEDGKQERCTKGSVAVSLGGESIISHRFCVLGDMTSIKALLRHCCREHVTPVTAFEQ